jgi:GPI mannosyltransferase 3
MHSPADSIHLRHLRAFPTQRAWWGLILLACLFRVVHSPLVTIHHPDELWQYLEPAFHLTGGDWVQTWEWREGIRSWLLPAILAGPMALGQAIAPGTQAYMLLPRLLMIGFSLLIVAAAIRLGARFSRRHALLAGFVAATWFELVYFGPRTLSEPLGVALFIAATPLLLDGRERTPARLALAGFLLGSAAMIRFQFGPAIAVLVLAALFRHPRALLPLIGGGIAAALVAGLVDLWAGAVPFRWIWANVHQNIVANRSAFYGVSGPFGYFDELAKVWSWSAVLLVPLAIAGAFRYPALMAAALTNLLVHSLIPHKEYRFVLLTTTIFVLLAALASADLIGWIGRKRSERWNGRALWGTAAAWLAVSVLTASVLPFARNWGRHGALPRALIAAGKVPEACGLAIVGRPENKGVVSSWAFYGRRTPMIMFYDKNGIVDATAYSASFNVLMAPYLSTPPPGYRFRSCSEIINAGRPNPPYCLWVRPGNCAPPPAYYHPSAVMERLGS